MENVKNNQDLKEIVKEVVREEIKPELDKMKKNDYLREGYQILND